MAHVTTILQASNALIRYLVTEDGNAAGAAEQRNVLADLTAQGFGAGFDLFDVLNNGAAALADQAAARALVYGTCDVDFHVRAAVPAGATAAPVPTLDPNVNGAAVGNFRLDIGVVKAANGDTAVFVVEIAFRHSIIQ